MENEKQKILDNIVEYYIIKESMIKYSLSLFIEGNEYGKKLIVQKEEDIFYKTESINDLYRWYEGYRTAINQAPNY